MHVHPSSPNSSQSEDDAATKIQAGFRGYRVRKQIRQGRPGSTGGVSGNPSAGAGSSSGGSQAQRSPRVGKKTTLEDKSATKIQAGIRGFLVRKRQKTATDAATKIQASFRGFKTRKDLKSTSKKDK
ncbi:IQ domain-containing protein N [Armigeres subalbatus]|uniref:IQ domain-containing protein N n=1 Tax=Armigeres subalbatus TaxID=124917 RepID=UPI002ED5FB1E